MFIHHIAIICSDRAQAVDFYVDKLGFEIISEHVRPKKDDILLNVAKDGLVLELFIKPNAPKRVSGATGEARGYGIWPLNVTMLQPKESNCWR